MAGPFDVSNSDAADVLSGNHPKSYQVDQSWGMSDPMDGECQCDDPDFDPEDPANADCNCDE